MKKLIICLTGFLSLIVIFNMPCYGGECSGDIDCDGVVDGSDLADFANGYGETDCNECIPAPVPKTGQTEWYTAGDDGYLQKGVAWPDPRFTDNSDGTVTDKLTGLIWTQDANLHGNGTWKAALSHCANCSEGGYTDWRLPNVRELHSLVDYGNFPYPFPGPQPFKNLVSHYYWASTTSVHPLTGNTSMAWSVGFFYGGLYRFDKITTTGLYVWCVRGGL